MPIFSLFSSSPLFLSLSPPVKCLILSNILLSFLSSFCSSFSESFFPSSNEFFFSSFFESCPKLKCLILSIKPLCSLGGSSFKSFFSSPCVLWLLVSSLFSFTFSSFFELSLFTKFLTLSNILKCFLGSSLCSSFLSSLLSFWNIFNLFPNFPISLCSVFLLSSFCLSFISLFLLTHNSSNFEVILLGLLSEEDLLILVSLLLLTFKNKSVFDPSFFFISSLFDSLF